MRSIDTIAQDNRHLIAAKVNDEATHSKVEKFFWQLLPALCSPAKLARSLDWPPRLRRRSFPLGTDYAHQLGFQSDRLSKLTDTQCCLSMAGQVRRPFRLSQQLNRNGPVSAEARSVTRDGGQNRRGARKIWGARDCAARYTTLQTDVNRDRPAIAARLMCVLVLR
jgi:hypothetical protein